MELTRRALNRALLHRQGLLERSPTPPLEMVERLVGMQAQVPANPYVGLWSRIEDFDPHELSGAIERGDAIRAGLMRGTIHLVTARDFRGLKAHMEPLYGQIFRNGFGAGLHGADIVEVVAAGRELLTGGPLTRVQISDALAPRWPDAEPLSLGQAVLTHLPVVQIPPRGLWGGTLQATWALANGSDPHTLEEVVLRYLAAFGPATVSDARSWSRLTGLRPVFERLRPQLRSLRDERGRALLDVPDGALPDPDTPAPVRFLPEYDNVLLGHEDRSRILPDHVRGPFAAAGSGHVLVDGFHAGHWRLGEGEVVLDGVEPSDEVEAERAALQAFLHR